MKFLENSKVIAYIFYILAILFCLYTIFSMVTTIQYLSSVVSSGMYAGVAFSDMLTAFVGQVGPYLFYTLVMFFCGYAIQILAGDIDVKGAKKEETTTSVEPASSYTGTLETADDVPVETTEEAPVEAIEDVVAEIEIPAEVDGEVIEEEVPVVEDDSDLTKKELDELEEGIEEFDKKTESDEEIDDIGL